VYGYRQGLDINFHCRVINSEDEIPQNPNLLAMSSIKEIENIKEREEIKRASTAIPIILSFQNRGEDDVSNIKFDVSAEIDAISIKGDLQFKFELKENLLENLVLRPEETSGIILFDISGFRTAKFNLLNLSYAKSQKETSVYRINAPIIFETARLSNDFNGFRSKEEFERWYFLDNYVSTALYSRSILLKLMFDNLCRLDGDELKIDNQRIVLRKAAKSSLKHAVQIDIISKIMMYIEDLVVILDSMLSFDGNYYYMLDRKETDGRDLGDRITHFMEHLDRFSEKDFRNMLSYAAKSEWTTEDKNQNMDIVEKIIKINIDQVLFLLRRVRDFRSTHNQVFRRYKHAGFAFRLNVEAGLYIDSKPYESYFMVYHERHDVLSNPLPIPFSSEVLESYKCLISSLETLLYDVIESKKACIERRIDKILPLYRYSSTGMTVEEMHLAEKGIEDFLRERPIYAYNSQFRFKGKVERRNIPWYLGLETFMDHCRKNEIGNLTQKLNVSTQNVE
jgi:hypothetical protein